MAKAASKRELGPAAISGIDMLLRRQAQQSRVASFWRHGLCNVDEDVFMIDSGVGGDVPPLPPVCV